MLLWCNKYDNDNDFTDDDISVKWILIHSENIIDGDAINMITISLMIICFKWLICTKICGNIITNSHLWNIFSVISALSAIRVIFEISPQKGIFHNRLSCQKNKTLQFLVHFLDSKGSAWSVAKWFRSSFTFLLKAYKQSHEQSPIGIIFTYYIAFKMTKIRPMNKSGDISVVNNFCPIFVFSVISKFLERSGIKFSAVHRIDMNTKPITF